MAEVKRDGGDWCRAAVDEVFRGWSWVMKMSFVERLNRSLRQRVAPIRRRSAAS